MDQPSKKVLSIVAALGGSPISNTPLLGSKYQDLLDRLRAVRKTPEHAKLQEQLDASDITIEEYHKAVGALLNKVGPAWT